MNDPYILYRPSFAGSWRQIGPEFHSYQEADNYALSEPWKEHGMFTDWRIMRLSEGEPASVPIQILMVMPGSTAIPNDLLRSIKP